jgi:predicted nucleic acid-binding protein
VTAVDSSVAVAAFVRGLPRHDEARAELSRKPAIPVHAAIETYSVMTRLPAPYRVDPSSAARLVGENLADRFLAGPTPRHVRAWLARFAELGIAGGAIYDALIAESARAAQRTLVTADARAAATYRALGVSVRMLGEGTTAR